MNFQLKNIVRSTPFLFECLGSSIKLDPFFVFQNVQTTEVANNYEMNHLWGILLNVL